MSASEHCAASPQRSEDASEHGRGNAIGSLRTASSTLPRHQLRKDAAATGLSNRRRHAPDRNMAAQETWKEEDYANVKDRCAAALKSEKTLELGELKHERVLIVERSLTTWAMGFDVYGLIIEADDIPDPDDKADTA
eukprot:103451-Chlamydomonas_euryale.AAC.1